MKDISKIRDVLEKDKTINVYHLSMIGRQKAHIEKIDGNKITLLIPEIGCVSLCDPLVCKINSNNNIYSLSCEVIQLNNDDEIQVEVQNIEIYNERRKNKRYAISLNSVISDIDTLNSEYAIAKVVSISGACLNCKSCYEVGMSYLISFIISQEDTIVLEGKVIRRKLISNNMFSQYEYGITFTSKDEVNLWKMKQYIAALEGDENFE